MKKYAIKKIQIRWIEYHKRNEAVMEANVLNTVLHPNIIGYRESFTECGYPYTVTDYSDSGDLLQLINERAKAKQSFSETEAMYYFVYILLAMKHVHIIVQYPKNYCFNIIIIVLNNVLYTPNLNKLEALTDFFTEQKTLGVK
ncbi:Kinase [Hexamita inflata]|uniref:non-specific serine/threonine protein kinase n=1 Tax=Hexamita inflata TaxID=28002 RepID=A0AA86NDK2_9EUKA|nr:Kinase [Hexamita inflata]